MIHALSSYFSIIYHSNTIFHASYYVVIRLLVTVLTTLHLTHICFLLFGIVFFHIYILLSFSVLHFVCSSYTGIAAVGSSSITSTMKYMSILYITVF